MDAQKVAIITGISGQDGSYLAELLLEKNYKVFGLTRDPGCLFNDRIKHLAGRVELLYCTYDPASFRDVLERTSPDEIYNLTGQTYVGKSWLMVEETIEASGLIPINLVRSIVAFNSTIKFFQASSCEIYTPLDDQPITEGSIIAPATPYGCSKALAHHAVCAYRNNYELFAVNGILFNHESPRRNNDFISKKVILKALEIKNGLADTLYVGNLDVRRDWGNAEDFVVAMYMMMQQEKPVDYHICTGRLHSVRELIDFVFTYLGMDYTQYIQTDSSLVRSNEASAVCGSNQKIRKELGWFPQCDFETMLAKMIEFEKCNFI